jgi:acyl carrier protein
MSPRLLRGTDLRAVGVITGWGEGLAALPADAARAAAGRSTVALDRPPPPGERFRRSTRECLLGVAAVQALLGVTGQAREDIAGSDTALLYATAAGYAASNRAFIEAAATGSALHFPYTAPSAVPAEVAIEFGLTGAYVIFTGGATTTLEALAHAAGLLRRGECARALVLAVETFRECEDLHARGRWLLGRPLVEAAACALLTAGAGHLTVADGPVPSDLGAEVRRRAGETLACEPLIALALGLESGDDRLCVTGAWRGRRLALEWSRSAAPCLEGHERSSAVMDPKEIKDELTALLVSRLKFEPARVDAVAFDTPLPKGVEGSIGLDSLDFIELGIAIEERFGIVMDESQDLAEHFASMETLCRFIAERATTP